MSKIRVKAKRLPDLKQWPDIVEAAETHQDNILDEALELAGGDTKGSGGIHLAGEQAHHSIESVTAGQGVHRGIRQVQIRRR